MSCPEPVASPWRLGRLTLCGLAILLSAGATNPRADWLVGGAPLNLTSGELRVGVDASYPPLAASAPDGGLYGLEVDLAEALATRLGVELRLTNTDVGGGLDALAGNQYDALLAGLSRSPDLADRAAFSYPYFDDGTRVVAFGAPPGGDLTGRRVSVELGSVADELARQTLRQGGRFELLRQREPDAVLGSLRDRSADVALLDAAQVGPALAREPDLRLGAQPFERRPLSLALRRVNRGLLFAVDRALETMQRDGTLGRLAHRWLGF